MAYGAGMLKYRIKIAKRAADTMGKYGQNSGGQKYQLLGTFWAGETFSKGAKALQEGAMEAYDVLMFRMRYNSDIDRWCLIQYRGKWYEIKSLQEDYQDNQIQIIAKEMANQKVTIIEPTPDPSSSEEAETENNVEQ
jgi:SPP1 family predicted phage head-tail adaptor